MDQQDLNLDMDESCPGGGEVGNTGTLHLRDGRHIRVLRLIHVGETFLFFSRADGPRAHVISRNEVRSWESMVSDERNLCHDQGVRGADSDDGSVSGPETASR